MTSKCGKLHKATQMELLRQSLFDVKLGRLDWVSLGLVVETEDIDSEKK